MTMMPKLRLVALVAICSHLLLLLPSTLNSFIVHVPLRQKCNRVLYNNKQPPKKDDENKKRGYQFGDFTKSILNKAGSSITGDKEYKFGQITKGILGGVAKSVANDDGNSTATSSSSYQFGDISKALLQRAGSMVTDYTGKDTYQVGDVTQEIIRRVQSGEYKTQDIMLLCKLLLTFGVGLTPVAGALPAKLILEMMNASLAQEVGGRLMEVLGKTLDERMKSTIMGDANYQLGDKAREAILQFIGKDSYSVGDISSRISELSRQQQKSDKKSGLFQLDNKNLLEELDAWDDKAKVTKKK